MRRRLATVCAALARRLELRVVALGARLAACGAPPPLGRRASAWRLAWGLGWLKAYAGSAARLRRLERRLMPLPGGPDVRS